MASSERQAVCNDAVHMKSTLFGKLFIYRIKNASSIPFLSLSVVLAIDSAINSKCAHSGLVKCALSNSSQTQCRGFDEMMDNNIFICQLAAKRRSSCHQHTN